MNTHQTNFVRTAMIDQSAKPPCSDQSDILPGSGTTCFAYIAGCGDDDHRHPSDCLVPATRHQMAFHRRFVDWWPAAWCCLATVAQGGSQPGRLERRVLGLS